MKIRLGNSAKHAGLLLGGEVLNGLRELVALQLAHLGRRAYPFRFHAPPRQVTPRPKC